MLILCVVQGAIKGGRRGLVPCNMIAKVEVPDSATLDALYSKGFLTSETTIKHKVGAIKHKENVRRNGTYSASPHSEKSQDSRKLKRYAHSDNAFGKVVD